MRMFSIIAVFCVSAAVLTLPLGGAIAAYQNEPEIDGEQQMNPCGRCPSQAECQGACPEEQAQPSFISYPVRMCGGAIDKFFAFGCKVNYQLTNWMLSDKCRIAPAEREDFR